MYYVDAEVVEKKAHKFLFSQSELTLYSIESLSSRSFK